MYCAHPHAQSVNRGCGVGRGLSASVRGREVWGAKETYWNLPGAKVGVCNVFYQPVPIFEFAGVPSILRVFILIIDDNEDSLCIINLVGHADQFNVLAQAHQLKG